jgi:hypothetical protein
MSYLLSSVDPVLYCGTNGPTHAPTFVLLAPSSTSVFDSLLALLGIVRFLVLLRRVVHSLLSVRYIQQQLRCCSLHSVL